jgi:O-antigen/teichoic acid export membrane protein
MIARGNDLKSRAMSAAAWSVVRTGGDQIIRFTVFVFLARILDPAHFGIYAIASIFVEYAKIVANSGLAEAIVQSKKADDELLDTIFWALMGLTALVAGVTAAVSPLLCSMAGVPEARPFMVALAATMLLGPLAAVHSSLGVRNFQNRSLTTRSMIASVLGAGAGLFGAYSGLGLWSLFLQSLVAGVFSVVLTWAMFPWRPGLRFSWKRLRSLWTFSGNMLVSRVLQVSVSRVQDLVAARFLGAAMLGQFRIGGRVFELMYSSLIGPLSSTAFPTLSRVQDDDERFARGYCRMLALSSLIAIPASFGFGALARDVVPLIFGPKWLLSIGVIHMLALLAPAQVQAWFAGPALAARGRPDVTSKFATMQLVGTTIFSLLAVKFGIVALAGAYVARSYLTLPVQLKMFESATGVTRRRIAETVGPPLIAAAIMTGGVLVGRQLLIEIPPVLRVISLVIIGGIIYAGSLALFFRKYVEDQVWSLVRERLGARRSYASVAG